MKAEIISLTMPVKKEIAHLNAEGLIVYTARVSNPDNQMNSESAPRLIRYLIENKHWSPFEMVDMTIEIKTSRAIAAQILRHRSFSFQEFSQRYAKAMGIEEVEIREQAAKNRQSSSEVFNPEVYLSDGLDIYNPKADKLLKHHFEKTQEIYNALLQANVAKEVARMVLPLATSTTIYMKGSLRSWIHYLMIRADEHTQKEHRDIALAIKDIFEQWFPDIYEAIWPTPEYGTYMEQSQYTKEELTPKVNPSNDHIADILGIGDKDD